MAISDAQFIAWLSQEHADRVVLYEQDYMFEGTAGEPEQGTLYLSDKPYMPLDAALPYVECIASVPEFTRSLGGNRLNTYSSSIGSVEIVNTDGELDFLLDLAIDGSEARFYYGDASWARADFRLIFTVLGLRVQRAPFRRLTIDLKDSTVLLNQSVGGTTLVGGGGPYANNARPLNVGFVHNLTPLSLDSINLTYVHSDSTFPVVIEVRDDGVPVTFTDNADGTLELNAAPAGLITCDVDSVTGIGQRNVSDTFERLVGARGGFTAAGLYFGPHPTFVIDDADDYPIGMSIGDARNIIDILGELTESGNCFTAIRRDGQFTYGRLRPYDIEGFGDSSGLAPVNIVEDDIVPRTAFDLEHLIPEYYQYQAYAHKNWTVQSNLSAILAPDEQARFQRKGQYALQSLVGGTDYATAPELYHKTLTTSPPIETLLSWDDDSSIIYLTTWMETRRAMFLPWIEIATVSLPLGANPDDPAMFYALELGDVTNVTLSRFGYDAGTLFQVMSVGINLSQARTTLRMVRKRGISAPPVGWETSEQYLIQIPFEYRMGPPAIETIVTVPQIGVTPGAPGGGGGGLMGPIIIIFQPTPGTPPAPEDEFYFMDTFSEAGVALDTHLPEIGSAYANDPDYLNRGFITCVENVDLGYHAIGNYVQAFIVSGESAVYGIAPIVPESADYFLDAQFSYDNNSEGPDVAELWFMSRKNGDTFYLLHVGLGQGATVGYDYSTMTLTRIVGGSPSGIVATNNDVPLTRGVQHHLYWTLVNVTHKVYLDGDLIFDDDDSGIPDAGDEIGFGSEGYGPHGAGQVRVDWLACGGLDAGPEFQMFNDPTVGGALTLGPDVASVRTIEYPSTGVFQIELSLINWDPASTYSFGWSDAPPGSFAGLTVAGGTPSEPFVAGTFDAAVEHPLGATFTIFVAKNAVNIMTIELVPAP